MSRPYMSARQAALALGLSPRTFLRAVERAEIRPAFRTPGGRFRFHEEAIAAYAARLASGSMPRSPLLMAPSCEERDVAWESEERFRALSEYASDLVSILGADGLIHYASPSHKRILGYDPRALEGTDSFALIHPDDRDRMRALFTANLRMGGTGAPFEMRYRHANGSWRTLEASGVDRLHDPAVRGFIVNSHDVTDRLEAEEALRLSEERYRRIVETTQEGIWQIDADGRTTFVNCRMAEMLGYSVEELRGVSPLALKDGDEQALLASRLDARQRGQIGQSESKYRRKDGSELWVWSSANPLFDDQGRYLGAFSTMVNITTRKKVEETLRRVNRARAAISACTRAAARATTEAELLQQVCDIIVATGGYRFAWVWFALHGEDKSVRPVAYAGQEDGYLQDIAVSWADTPLGRGPTGTAIRTGQPSTSQDMQTDPAYTHWRAAALARGYASAIALPLRREGEALGALSIYSSVPDAFDAEEVSLLMELADDLAYGLAALRARVERARAEEALAHQALHDALTGLPNRRLLYDRLEQALLAAGRAGVSLALLLLDLDHFKEVNDTFGHHHGDLLLCEVGARLAGLLRGADTVARLGGDEFAIILGESDAAGAERVALQVRIALDAPIMIEGQALHAAGSIGVVVAPEHGDDAHTLLRRADVAMYAAKSSKAGHVIYAPAQDRHSRQRLTLIGDLREAIAGGALALHYQPQVAPTSMPFDARGGRVLGVEALVRWRHPRLGAIAPSEFIPLVERSGLIKPLTEWVVGEALRERLAWARYGVQAPVSINLSAWSLHDPELAPMIAALLRKYGAPPDWLRVEVTEGTLMADVTRTLAVLADLVALGVRVSVDDYGTGYSSLAYLKRLPVDELKIDRSFVRDLSEDEADAAIVRSTVALGHALGLCVVAEGVEDEEVWRALGKMGCDVVQGYYVCRPLSAPRFRRWLRDVTHNAHELSGT
jgi:diguanylate cyclase (GGDEF)-like protein/PAS domain S-box-containing protein/excisionase family DNA binding protein